MKKMFILIAAILTMTFSAVAQTEWRVDNVHSNVKFSVTHLIISDVEGSFNVYSGTLLTQKPDFADAAVDFAVDVPSINNGQQDARQPFKIRRLFQR